jgi:hypothetical protein
MAGMERSAMPRDGAVILADVRAPTLSIVCERCRRYGRYDVQQLFAVHGADAKSKLPELLDTLANCEKARSVSIQDRCQARFDAGFRRRV